MLSYRLNDYLWAINHLIIALIKELIILIILFFIDVFVFI